MDDGGNVEIDSLILANSDIHGAYNGKDEKHETNHGKKIKVDTVFATDVAEQVRRNHIGHRKSGSYVYILAYIFFEMFGTKIQSNCKQYNKIVK
jgi:hypothetical protein